MVLGPVVLHAQQIPQYAFYQLNPSVYHPGYTGLDKTGLNITGQLRRQWTGLQGAPGQQLLTAHLPLSLVGGGVGARIEFETLGPASLAVAQLNYAYHIGLEDGVLGLGIGAGLAQYGLRGNQLITPEGDYSGGMINHNDNTLPTGRVNANAPLVHLGVYLRKGAFEGGLSVLHANGPQLKWLKDNVTGALSIRRGYVLSSSYTLETGTNFALQPSILIKSDLIQTTGEINVLGIYNDNIFVGASFRGYNRVTIDAASAMAGLRLNDRFVLGYAYEIPVSSLRIANQGSHEVIIRYQLNQSVGKGVPPPIIYNPRLD